jgi:hypothetical protein
MAALAITNIGDYYEFTGRAPKNKIFELDLGERANAPLSENPSQQISWNYVSDYAGNAAKHPVAVGASFLKAGSRYLTNYARYVIHNPLQAGCNITARMLLRGLFLEAGFVVATPIAAAARGLPGTPGIISTAMPLVVPVAGAFVAVVLGGIRNVKRDNNPGQNQNLWQIHSFFKGSTKRALVGGTLGLVFPGASALYHGHHDLLTTSHASPLHYDADPYGNGENVTPDGHDGSYGDGSNEDYRGYHDGSYGDGSNGNYGGHSDGSSGNYGGDNGLNGAGSDGNYGGPTDGDAGVPAQPYPVTDAQPISPPVGDPTQVYPYTPDTGSNGYYYPDYIDQGVTSDVVNMGHHAWHHHHSNDVARDLNNEFTKRNNFDGGNHNGNGINRGNNPVPSVQQPVINHNDGNHFGGGNHNGNQFNQGNNLGAGRQYTVVHSPSANTNHQENHNPSGNNYRPINYNPYRPENHNPSGNNYRPIAQVNHNGGSWHGSSPAQPPHRGGGGVKNVGRFHR